MYYGYLTYYTIFLNPHLHDFNRTGSSNYNNPVVGLSRSNAQMEC